MYPFNFQDHNGKLDFEEFYEISKKGRFRRILFNIVNHIVPPREGK